jgi:hypothetical protein
VKNIIIMLFLLVLVSGCSSINVGKLVKYEMTYNSGKIYNTKKLSAEDFRSININMPYFSYLDATSQEVSSSGLYVLYYNLSYDGTISDFWTEELKDACIQIVDTDNDFKDLSGCFKNPLLYEYHKTTSEINKTYKEIIKLKETLPKGEQTLLNQLRKNESYSNNRCQLLATESLPNRPETICDNPEWLAQARLACLAPLGAKVCRSLTDGKVEKFVAGNACSAALKGKLNSSDLIFEALDSAADELGDGSGSFSDIAGTLVSGALSFTRLMETYSCVEGLFPGCESKIKNWELEVDKIERFPRENKNKCDILFTKYTKLATKSHGVKNEIDDLEKKLSKLFEHIEKVKKDTYSGTF